MDWMMHVASLCQHEVRLTQAIAYLGPIYSYSYLAAVKQNPNISQAQFHLGVILAIEGDVEASKAHFKEAIRTSASPDITDAMRQWVDIAEKDPKRFQAMMKDFYSTL